VNRNKPSAVLPGNGVALSVAATAASFIYVSSLCYLSFISAGSLGELYRRTGIGGDDILHIMSFVALGFVLFASFSTYFYRRVVKSPRAWSVFVSAILAIVIELVQVSMPTRHASFFDLSLHASGILIFYYASIVFQKRRAKAVISNNRKEVDLTLK